MEDNIYIGLDHSISSPGICIIQGQSIEWISHYKASEDEQVKLLKKEGPFNTLDSSEHIKINFLTRNTSTPLNYSEGEYSKLISLINSVDSIITSIKENIKNKKGEVFFAMEGLAFGASGNILIDISMSTAILRKRILEEVLEFKPNLYVFSPSSIKKYAIRGNAEKAELYRSLLLREDVAHSELIQLMKMHELTWITPGGTVKKPIEDLVDSSWVALYLKDVIEKKVTLEETKTKSKKRKKSEKS